MPCQYEIDTINRLSLLTDLMAARTKALQLALVHLDNAKGIIEESEMIRDTILVKMEELRLPCDEAETLTSKEYWPFPTYGDLLFSVNS